MPNPEETSTATMDDVQALIDHWLSKRNEYGSDDYADLDPMFKVYVETYMDTLTTLFDVMDETLDANKIFHTIAAHLVQKTYAATEAVRETSNTRTRFTYNVSREIVDEMVDVTKNVISIETYQTLRACYDHTWM